MIIILKLIFLSVFILNLLSREKLVLTIELGQVTPVLFVAFLAREDVAGAK